MAVRCQRRVGSGIDQGGDVPDAVAVTSEPLDPAHDVCLAGVDGEFMSVRSIAVGRATAYVRARSCRCLDLPACCEPSYNVALSLLCGSVQDGAGEAIRVGFAVRGVRVENPYARISEGSLDQHRDQGVAGQAVVASHDKSSRALGHGCDERLG